MRLPAFKQWNGSKHNELVPFLVACVAQESHAQGSSLSAHGCLKILDFMAATDDFIVPCLVQLCGLDKFIYSTEEASSHCYESGTADADEAACIISQVSFLVKSICVPTKYASRSS